MAKYQSFLSRIGSNRDRAALRGIFSQFLTDDDPPALKDLVLASIVLSGAETTQVTISGACTTGILQSGTSTTAYSITGAFTTGINIAADGTTAIAVTNAFSGVNAISLAGTGSTAGINISGNHTTAITIGAQTTAGVAITGATATGISVTGACSTAALQLGVSGTPAGDFIWYGTTALYKVLFDADGDTNGAVYFGADTKGLLVSLYGDTTGCGVFWDPSTDTNGTLSIGAAGGSKGNDFAAYGATNGNYMQWDQSANSLLLVGTSTVLNIAGTTAATDATTGALICAGGAGIGGNAHIGGRVVLSAIPTAHTDSTLSVGVYGTPLVDATLVDNILTSINYSTATNKTAADTSCMALYVGNANTAATTNNKMQGILSSVTLHGNLYDGYAVQGHITVHDALSTQNANAHITGLSGKALVSAAVGQGWVTGVLAILDGAGGVTGLAHALAAQVEAGFVGADAIAYLGADAATTSGIEFAGTANLTNIFKFNAIAGAVVANALVPATAPDGGTVGADAALVCDIGGTPYYIPLYNTLHA